MNTVLSQFHPLVASWFQERFGAPTAVQTLAWERIAQGEHVLATAATGSGKTLAAFLWALNQLIAGSWPTGLISVVYVSPLKALNNDVQRNLSDPLAALAEWFAARGGTMPEIRAMVRSGDTPPIERARMLRRPPEILITTPESLNLLLSSHGGRRVLTDVRTIILDEIHAVAGTKRGTWLMTAVERLARQSEDMQRIALSATVRPLDVVAEFVGGQEQQADGGYRPRRVSVIEAPSTKVIDIAIVRPRALASLGSDDFWPALAAELKTIIAANRSTLFFTNSRRMSEKLARFLNEGEAEPLAYAHHGSLARDLRALVEARLKNGELRALVATSSLELGIDIGSIDEVVLVQCPRSLNACIQRVGRAGHQVGAISHGRVIPLHERDLLEAAVMVPLAASGSGEALSPIENPLDVLAQVLVGMCGVETWDVDALYGFIRTCRAYRDLDRPAFDSVVDLLIGRSGDNRLREITPRLRLITGPDGRDVRLEARAGALRVMYQSGGVIPDRGYFAIRIQGSGARIGELDEEFVWERHSGDEFSIGTQTWRIARITHSDVEVVPGNKPGAMAPFWRAEAEDRDWSLGSRIGEFCRAAEGQLDDPGFAERLRAQHRLDHASAEALIGYLARQRQATGRIPHRHLVVAERTPDPAGGDHDLLILHLSWGGRVLRPLSIAFAAAWHERFGADPELTVTDDCFMCQVPRGFTARDLLALVPARRIAPLLRARLSTTGFFGARFRENAARALLLPRPNLRERMPLWLTRLRAKKLLDIVADIPDFPIVVETWRTCLRDAFDLERLEALLGEFEDGTIALHEVRTDVPSPFAEGLAWTTTNIHVYADDTPNRRAAVSPSDRALDRVIRTPELRPRIVPERAAEFQHKLQRTHPGYAPAGADEIADLVGDRVLVPEPEWRALLEACMRDHAVEGFDRDGVLGKLSGRLLILRPPGARVRSVVSITSLPRLLRCWGRDLDQLEPSAVAPVAGMLAAWSSLASQAFLDDAEEDPTATLLQCLAEWLRSYGPISDDQLAAAWGLDAVQTQRQVEQLAEDETIVREVLLAGDERPLLCDAENYERLLRLARAAQRPSFRPLPCESLPWFLARWQGLVERGHDIEALQDALERLFGHVAAVDLWEGDILPARLESYQGAWLDSLLQTTDLMWFGAGRERIGFCFREALPQFIDAADDSPAGSDLAQLFPDPHARYEFFAIQKHSGVTSTELTARLWDHAWHGRIANDGMAAVRQGALHGFKAQPMAGLSTPRTGLRGWQTTRPLNGAWYRINLEATNDAIDDLERDRDRVRLLLDRYGVLFRELLANELGPLTWSRLLPALRLMELSGEIVAGVFFSGVPGLQFSTIAALRRLGEIMDGNPAVEDRIYWMSALDPASCCGLKLEALRGQLPARVASTHLILHGRRTVMVSRRSGKQLDIAVDPDDPQLPRYLAPLRAWLGRAFKPMRALTVESINGEPSLSSPYASQLVAFGFHRDLKHLVLRRNW
ncbi:MAG: DEAD/DEAH box helicase [Planctomycetes bacterium]|nr:DEAD/DEAH box helicase [Planctomycetota bacterium]